MASNQLSSKVALKAINNDSDNIILNELKIHHKCRNPRVIPFYGITKAPGGNEYAMVIRHAEHGDLRNYIRRFFPILTWTNRGTPEFYANIMERCWSSDPLKRPDASLLPKLFEDMLCKVADDNIASSKVTCYSSLSKSNFVNNNSVNTGYDTRALDLGLNMAPTKEENTVMINHNNSVDIELSPQTNSVTSSNESIIQSEYKTKAYEYTLEGQYTEFLKYEIKANHLIITILLFDTKYHNFKLLVYTVVSASKYIINQLLKDPPFGVPVI
ncbi:unnamed protein product [Rhizophagus irregularis]|nr:unnamed protein product [Rhizophagus irregularis]